MVTLAIIPARSGSKSIAHKNIKEFLGKELIAWSIEHARQAKCVDRVVVSTDSEDYAVVARKHGAETPFLRPPSISGDRASTEEVLLHALSEIDSQGAKIETVILLQCTSPIRSPSLIDNCFEMFRCQGSDSFLTVCPDHSFGWYFNGSWRADYDYFNRPMRQQIPADKVRYRETGSVYIINANTLRASRNRLCGNVSALCTSRAESYEIDEPEDWLIAESIAREFYSGSY